MKKWEITSFRKGVHDYSKIIINQNLYLAKKNYGYGSSMIFIKYLTWEKGQWEAEENNIITN